MKIVPRLLKVECFLGSSLKLDTHCADERMAHKWSENSMFRSLIKSCFFFLYLFVYCEVFGEMLNANEWIV